SRMASRACASTTTDAAVSTRMATASAGCVNGCARWAALCASNRHGVRARTCASRYPCRPHDCSKNSPPSRLSPKVRPIRRLAGCRTGGTRHDARIDATTGFAARAAGRAQPALAAHCESAVADHALRGTVGAESSGMALVVADGAVDSRVPVSVLAVVCRREPSPGVVLRGHGGARLHRLPVQWLGAGLHDFRLRVVRRPAVVEALARLRGHGIPASRGSGHAAGYALVADVAAAGHSAAVRTRPASAYGQSAQGRCPALVAG